MHNARFCLFVLCRVFLTVNTGVYVYTEYIVELPPLATLPPLSAAALDTEQEEEQGKERVKEKQKLEEQEAAKQSGSTAPAEPVRVRRIHTRARAHHHPQNISTCGELSGVGWCVNRAVGVTDSMCV